MASKYTPAELVEIAVEWALTKDEGSFMVTKLPVSELLNRSLMDVEKIDLTTIDPTVSTYLDLKKLVEQEVNEKNRVQILQDAMMTFFLDKEVGKEAEKLMDEEAEKLGLVGTYKSFDGKATAVAKGRVYGRLMELAKIDDAAYKYEFEVLLETLRAGYGNLKKTMKLYFEYAIDFEDFLEILQEATYSSVIPPNDLKKLYTFSADSDDEAKATENTSPKTDPFDPATSANRTRAAKMMSSRSASASVRIVSSSSTATTDSTLSQATIVLPDNKVRGYTLDHGAWLWRHDHPGQRKSWKRVTDEKSFMSMIDTLQARARMSNNKDIERLEVFMCHAMDLAAQKEWKKIEAKQDEDERQFVEAMKEMELTNDDIGSPIRPLRLFDKCLQLEMSGNEENI